MNSTVEETTQIVEINKLCFKSLELFSIISTVTCYSQSVQILRQQKQFSVDWGLLVPLSHLNMIAGHMRWSILCIPGVGDLGWGTTPLL